jgi:hypothetical protein
MKTPKKKKFVFEISIEDIPHTAETCEWALGSKYYNPDFGVHCHAIDSIFEVLKDAHCGAIEAKMRHLVECKCDTNGMSKKQKATMKFLKERVEIAKYVENSLKFVRMEEI